MVYRRSEDPIISLRDPNYETKVEQWKQVEVFFAAFTNADDSIQQGYNLYKISDHFRSEFETHLKTLVQRLLSASPMSATVPPDGSVTSDLPQWVGSPFPGLWAFTPADAPIFFGRGSETDTLINRFKSNSFIAVVGASGSGKSSLVGAIPRLKLNVIEGSKDWLLPDWNSEGKQWVGLRFTPGEVGGNPFMALALKLGPMLGETPRNLATQLEQEPGKLAAICISLFINRQPGRKPSSSSTNSKNYSHWHKGVMSCPLWNY